MENPWTPRLLELPLEAMVCEDFDGVLLGMEFERWGNEMRVL